ncbi:MAG: hypothetical protein CL928_16965 [Deltaproteobacteria bacterium]|nr:hypothetical protein [Deltaproteobacteria bacterium]|tara:strand:- start:511 stop:987 length:477 start_codon:yes stop_codon:yes gene_type:complete
MSRFALCAALALMLLNLTACATTQSAFRNNRIEGTVTNEQGDFISRVTVTISVTDSDSDLIGTTTTNYAGRYTINVLSSPTLKTEAPIIANHTYDVNLESTDHYIKNTSITYESGTETHDFTLEAKDSSLNDVETTTIEEDTDERQTVPGAPPRRGTQ